MFTWICPKCKMEVPPHLSECPNCSATPETAAPVAAAPPPQAPVAQRVQYAPAPARGLPPWLITIIAAGVLVGVGALAYYFLLPGSRGDKPQAAAAAKSEAPTAKAVHPYAKFIEVTGIRVSEDKKKNVQIRMDVVNHSLAEVSDMELKVGIRSASAKPGDPPMCEVVAKVPALGPQESKDVSAVGKTQFRAYELPDWQFLRVDYEIISPKL